MTDVDDAERWRDALARDDLRVYKLKLAEKHARARYEDAVGAVEHALSERHTAFVELRKAQRAVDKAERAAKSDVPLLTARFKL